MIVMLTKCDNCHKLIDENIELSHFQLNGDNMIDLCPQCQRIYLKKILNYSNEFWMALNQTVIGNIRWKK